MSFGSIALILGTAVVPWPEREGSRERGSTGTAPGGTAATETFDDRSLLACGPIKVVSGRVGS